MLEGNELMVDGVVLRPGLRVAALIPGAERERYGVYAVSPGIWTDRTVRAERAKRARARRRADKKRRRF